MKSSPATKVPGPNAVMATARVNAAVHAVMAVAAEAAVVLAVGNVVAARRVAIPNLAVATAGAVEISAAKNVRMTAANVRKCSRRCPN